MIFPLGFHDSRSFVPRHSVTSRGKWQNGKILRLEPFFATSGKNGKILRLEWQNSTIRANKLHDYVIYKVTSLLNLTCTLFFLVKCFVQNRNISLVLYYILVYWLHSCSQLGLHVRCTSITGTAPGVPVQGSTSAVRYLYCTFHY